MDGICQSYSFSGVVLRGEGQALAGDYRNGKMQGATTVGSLSKVPTGIFKKYGCSHKYHRHRQCHLGRILRPN
jgi:hypothetical protein